MRVLGYDGYCRHSLDLAKSQAHFWVVACSPFTDLDFCFEFCIDQTQDKALCSHLIVNQRC